MNTDVTKGNKGTKKAKAGLLRQDYGGQEGGGGQNKRQSVNTSVEPDEVREHGPGEWLGGDIASARGSHEWSGAEAVHS